jgi:hypothetical protein
MDGWMDGWMGITTTTVGVETRMQSMVGRCIIDAMGLNMHMYE